MTVAYACVVICMDIVLCVSGFGARYRKSSEQLCAFHAVAARIMGIS